LGPTVTIEVDFGEAGASKVFKKNSEVKILDENNRLIEVTTMVEAANFFYNYGYEFVSSNSFATGNGLNGTNVYHWLLKKK
jgi:hypothetical protein